jgi:hypothetical protein
MKATTPPYAFINMDIFSASEILLGIFYTFIVQIFVQNHILNAVNVQIKIAKFHSMPLMVLII